MLTESIARRYAKAVFAASLERKAVDTFGHELQSFVKTLNEERGLRALWISLQLAEGHKKDLIRKSFPEFSKLMSNFLNVLIEKHRERIIDQVLIEYEKLLLDFYNQVYVEVKSAAPVPEKIQVELKERLSKHLGKRVELLVSQDPSLLGGMVLKIGDRVIDGSIRTQLDEIREMLLSAPLPA